MDCAGAGKNTLPKWIIGRPEMAKFLKLIKDKKGATAIEYGLIAALIAVAAIGALSSVGTQLKTTFNTVSDSLSTANA